MKKLLISGIFLFNYLLSAQNTKAQKYPSGFDVCIPSNSQHNVYFVIARENDPVNGPQHIFHLDKHTHPCQPISIDNEELVYKNKDLKGMYITSVQVKQGIKSAKNPYAEDPSLIFESQDTKNPTRNAIKIEPDVKYEIHIAKKGKKYKCPPKSLCACSKGVCVELKEAGTPSKIIR